MPAPPRLSPANRRAAYELYLHGLSLNQLSNLIWQQTGFPHAKACQAALVRAFRTRELRSPREASFLRWSRERCAGCDCEMDERSFGCRPCHVRHHARKKRGQSYVAIVCRGCGCSLDERTSGCKTCSNRVWKRSSKRGLAPTGVVEALSPASDTRDGRQGVGPRTTERRAA